jgi:leader peptidase (prepilin peptidase) / N-methyltransferase
VSADTAALVVAGLLLGLLGLAVGSFLNVVVYRVPLGLSIVRPGSACPGCHTPIAARDNIPVLSWLLLRGRCRTCGTRISARYPLVELLNAVLWLGLAWWAVTADALGLLPLLLVLGSAGVALAFIDLEHHRLPDAIVLPLYPVTVLGLVLAGLVSGEWPLASAGIGVAVWLGVIGGLWLLSGGRGMGFGDVKLAPVLGATLGWTGVGAAVVALFAAFALGAVVGIVLLLARKAGRRSALPFGPFLLVGALIGLVIGPRVADAYLGTLTGS